MKIKSPAVLKVINIWLILWGCAVIWAMSTHHSVIMGSGQDPFSHGRIYGYFFFQPYVKAIYGIVWLMIILKEFFLKKSIAEKVKINFIIGLVLPIFLLIQMGIWYFYYFNFAIKSMN